MSTRCQIFVEGLKSSLYRHSDGYPDSKHGVLATLVPIVNDFKNRRGWDDEYLLARIAQRMMNAVDPDGCTCFGIYDETHGDIEYLYLVRQDFSIEVRNYRRELVQTVNAPNVAPLER